MKIHILGLRGLPSTYSGYETFIGELAPRLVKRGHEVTVYCRRALYLERPAEWRGVRLRYLPGIEHKAFSTLSHSFLAMTKAARARPDVILAVNAATGWFMWIPRVYGVPCAVNVDGMEWLRPKWNRLARFMFLNGARMACRFGSAVVTDAEEMHRIYATEFGVDSTYIAYGANIERSRNPDAVRKYGLTPGRYFLSAGRMVPDNNADLIVRAFGLVKSDFELAVAGGADYRGNAAEREYLSLVKSQADHRVRFLGHVDDPDDFRELCCNCFAYVHAHEFGGINPSILNALGCGNMVLALDTPFNAEVLDGGKYGLLYGKNEDSLAGRMQELCDHPESAAGFRKSAHGRIEERFMWEHITDQYEELFKGLRRQTDSQACGSCLA